MNERPILMNADMVRATLAGTKTQTRRLVKWRGLAPGLNLGFSGLSVERSGSNWVLTSPSRTSHEYRSVPMPCPFGLPGDRLWVRETWQAFERGGDVYDGIPAKRPNDCGLLFAADDVDTMGYWRPSIHMPRWASRILLEVTAVRVERLQSISEADAQAEGCAPECMTPTGDDGGSALHGPGGFIALWESINGPGSWDVNPWLWVVEFRRIAP